MSWSLGEVASLVAKAARGAGHPWGVAEEAAWAVRWLSACGVDGAEICATWLARDEGACPVSAGLAIRDRGGVSLPSELGDLAAPALVLPFLAWTLADDGQVGVTMAGCRCVLSREGMTLSGELPNRAAVEVRAHDGPRPAPRAVWRVASISQSALGELQALATRTYAPASEQSRLLGAGAGLTDND